MDWTALGSTAAGVLATAAAIVAILAYRRQFPLRRLTFTVISQPLSGPVKVFLDDEDQDRLEAVVGRRGVHNPHVLLFELRSRSGADIASTNFDAGRSIVFKFHSELIAAEANRWGAVDCKVEGRRLILRPQLIRKRARVQMMCLTEGESGVRKIENPLIDIPIIDDLEESPRTLGYPRWELRFLVWVLIPALLSMFLVIYLIAKTFFGFPG